MLGVARSVTEAIGDVPQAGTVVLDQPDTIARAVRAVRPDEIYYLAAHHSPSQATPVANLHGDLRAGHTTNVAGLLGFLEAVRLHAPRSRVFFASSSLVFGGSPVQQPQDESTPVAPDEPYGWQKALSAHACAEYRRRHRVHAAVGILYNHESELRAPQFLSAKIVHAAVRAGRGERGQLVLGDLDGAVDWGYAPDFVEAFTRILALEEPDDFVIATGTPHTVREFAALAFGHLGLDWQHHVTTDPALLARRPGARVGNSAKVRRATGWRPSVTFEQMVHLLVDQAARHSPPSAAGLRAAP